MVNATTYVVALVAAIATVGSATQFESEVSDLEYWRPAKHMYCKRFPRAPICRARLGDSEEFLEFNLEEAAEDNAEIMGFDWKKYAKKAGKAYCKLYPQKAACRLLSEDSLQAELEDELEEESNEVAELEEVFDEEEFNALTGGRWKKWAKKAAGWAKKAAKVYCKLNPAKCGGLMSEVSELEDAEINAEAEVELDETEDLNEEEFNALTGGRWKKWAKKAAGWAKKGAKVYCKLNPSKCLFAEESEDADYLMDAQDVELIEEETTDFISDSLTRHNWYKNRREHPEYKKCLEIKDVKLQRQCKRQQKKAYKKCRDVTDPKARRECKRHRHYQLTPKKCRAIKDVKERAACVKKARKERRVPKKCRAIKDLKERSACVKKAREERKERRFPKECMALKDPKERKECLKKHREQRKKDRETKPKRHCGFKGKSCELKAEAEDFEEVAELNGIDPAKMSKKALQIYCALYPEKRICRLL